MPLMRAVQTRLHVVNRGADPTTSISSGNGLCLGPNRAVPVCKCTCLRCASLHVREAHKEHWLKRIGNAVCTPVPGFSSKHQWAV